MQGRALILMLLKGAEHLSFRTQGQGLPQLNFFCLKIKVKTLQNSQENYILHCQRLKM